MKGVCRGVDSPSTSSLHENWQLNLKQPEGIFRQMEVGAAEELSLQGPFLRSPGAPAVALTAPAALTHYLSSGQGWVQRNRACKVQRLGLGSENEEEVRALTCWAELPGAWEGFQEVGSSHC